MYGATMSKHDYLANAVCSWFMAQGLPVTDNTIKCAIANALSQEGNTVDKMTLFQSEAAKARGL